MFQGEAPGNHVVVVSLVRRVVPDAVVVRILLLRLLCTVGVAHTQVVELGGGGVGFSRAVPFQRPIKFVVGLLCACGGRRLVTLAGRRPLMLVRVIFGEERWSVGSPKAVSHLAYRSQ